MKLAVLSDIHGNLAALEAVLDEVAREHVDAVANLGDILSGPLQPAATADFLVARGFTTIAGNHERQLLHEHAHGTRDPLTSDGFAAHEMREPHLAWLRSLPPVHWLEDDVLLVHGTPGSDLTYWLETVTDEPGPGMRPASEAEVRERLHAGATGAPRASLVLCGHTHVPRAMRCGATLVVNPGSVGLQGYDSDYPMPHRMENGSPDARYAIVERRAAGWSVRLCSVPYDFAPQAKLAAERGRPDWAYALATGRLPPAPPTIAA